MNKLKIYLLILGTFFMTTTNLPAQTDTRNVPKKMFGLTIDSVSDIETVIKQINEIKAGNSTMPVVRIVFDFDKEAVDNKFRLEEKHFEAEAQRYKTAIEKLRPHAYIVGLLVDSSYVHYLRHDRRRTHAAVVRTRAYAKKLNGLVDIWELGNEINGEWVGWEDSEAHAKPSVTLEQLTAARELAADEVMQSVIELKKIIPDAKTALTFYYNDDGKGNTGWTDNYKTDGNGEKVYYGKHYSMTVWAREQRKRLPDFDYVWLSYYEDDNRGVTPNKTNPDFSGLVGIMVEMADLFKTAEIGIGEFAPQCKYDDCKIVNDERDRTCRKCKNDQPPYIKRYYVDWDKEIRKALAASSDWDKNRIYNGGYFYWYFRQDAANRKTVNALKDAFADWYGK
jgi:hypothetical protein